MANTSFVTVDSNGALKNQGLGTSLPGYTANTSLPAPVLVLPIDAIANASTSFIKTIPTTEGTTYRIVGIDVIKAASVGGAGDTVAVINNGAAVTGAVSLNTIADKAELALPIDDANMVYTSGTPLGVSTVKATNDPSCYVYIKLVKLT